MRCRYEFNVTYRCNATCSFCNRLVGVAKLGAADLTAEQAGRALSVLESRGIVPTQVTLAGGEPMLGREFEAIARTVAESGVRRIRLLSNGELERRRAELDVPRRAKWVVAPVRDKVHYPFLVSPADAGERPRPDTCRVISHCGRGLDAHGFAMCAVAPVIGRVLGIDPYDRQEPLVRPWEPICRHCPYSISRRRQKRLYQLVASGELQHPTPSYRSGLERLRSDGPPEHPLF